MTHDGKSFWAVLTQPDALAAYVPSGAGYTRVETPITFEPGERADFGDVEPAFRGQRIVGDVDADNAADDHAMHGVAAVRRQRGS